ncbi:23S rRNA G2445 N2-methylase RlmL [Paenibacillus forsythiae]|uniref:23S rRNA G2445 N2-methylase RlmL n=1 Tax=Paenibacillus forsythiae TaxID=365616 RepID=A0ABU3HDW8_9BACL|nr:methyltransferase domain-containing protein [Paenibacillus forsythiae]MDT3428686.1 23S rRNA G2445 N2-methylase RlmL [Paenibacillus forsythiae]
MALYFVTVLPGLEHVLENEIGVKIPDAKIQRIERGKVYFHSSLSMGALTVLRTADNLYCQIHRFQVGPHKIHLAEIEHEIAQLDLSREFPEHFGTIRYKVNASRAGKHTYSRFDAAEAAARGIARCDRRYRLDMTGRHEMEFRLDIHHEDAVFALRLTDASYRYRTEQRRFTHAALRPSVAHALVWLSNPEATDIVVDPCCGSGTIVSERLAYPYDQIDGGDLSEEAVEASIENIGFYGRLRIRHWDARHLPIDAGFVDKVVTNLPFGRQISTDEDIPKLYYDVFKEMKRVLKSDGSLLCLTDADAAARSAAEKLQFRYSTVTTLCLKGLNPTLLLLKKL